jgi:hypothetical protein
MPKQNRVRPTGINVGPFGASWDYSESEKDIAASILTYLEGRRVLFSPLARGCPNGVIDSVQEIRDRVEEDMQKIQRDTALYHAMDEIRFGILVFLNATCQNCPTPQHKLDRNELPDRTREFSCNDCKVYASGCADHLDWFRYMMRRPIEKICRTFGLDVRGPLKECIHVTESKIIHDPPVDKEHQRWA